MVTTQKKKYTLDELENMPVNKWQKASLDLTQAKIGIENVLSKFTEEEKKSPKYKDLFESLQLMQTHLNEDFNPTFKDDQKKKKRFALIKQIGIICGSIILGFIVNDPADVGALIAHIVNFLGGR